MSGKPYPTAPSAAGGYGGYPQQQPLYPQQYPQQQYPQAHYPYQQPYSTAGPYSSAPPPYSEAPPAYTAYSQPQYPGYCPPPSHALYPQQAPVPQTVMAPNLYDPGARFDGVSQPRVPPPPPGVMPNAAQIASMQGHQVVGTQQKASWFSGGTHGGYTLGGF